MNSELEAATGKVNATRTVEVTENEILSLNEQIHEAETIIAQHEQEIAAMQAAIISKRSSNKLLRADIRQMKAQRAEDERHALRIRQLSRG